MERSRAGMMRGPTLRSIAAILRDVCKRGEGISLRGIRDWMAEYPDLAHMKASSRKPTLARALGHLYEAGIIDVSAGECMPYVAERMRAVSAVSEHEHVESCLRRDERSAFPAARPAIIAEARREHRAAVHGVTTGKWKDLRAFAPNLRVSHVRLVATWMEVTSRVTSSPRRKRAHPAASDRGTPEFSDNS